MADKVVIYPDPEITEFYKKHCALYGGVIVGMAFYKDEERMGVFSSLKKASAWSETLGEEWNCMFAPFIIDEPDYENKVLQ